MPDIGCWMLSAEKQADKEMKKHPVNWQQHPLYHKPAPQNYFAVRINEFPRNFTT